jgi:hypothetical protein
VVVTVVALVSVFGSACSSASDDRPAGSRRLCQEMDAWHRAIEFAPAHSTEEVVADLDRLATNLDFEATTYRSAGDSVVAASIVAAIATVKDYRRELATGSDSTEDLLQLGQAGAAGDKAMAAIPVACPTSD